jgi:hypothetical protein
MQHQRRSFDGNVQNWRTLVRPVGANLFETLPQALRRKELVDEAASVLRDERLAGAGSEAIGARR